MSAGLPHTQPVVMTVAMGSCLCQEKYNGACFAQAIKTKSFFLCDLISVGRRNWIAVSAI